MKNLEKIEKILRNKNYADNTIKIYLSYINSFILFYNKDKYQLTLKDLNSYLLNYNYTSVSQQNQIINSLKLYYKYILNKSNLNLSKIERPKKNKKLPNIIDSNLIINKINSIYNLKHKCILSLMYSCGLRVSEVLNLKISDIDSKRMIIKINGSKNNKDRLVPINNKLIILLRKYYVNYKPNIYLFNGKNTLKYSYSSCNKIVKKHLGDKYSCHTLRHSCFTHLLEIGINIKIIKELAGHSNIKTTEMYTHVSINTLKNIPSLL